MTKKLILFGLDGGSLEIIERMVEEGKLPTFEKLMDNGVYGKLESTIPPITVPAWPAMFTGLNPGNLGIVDHLMLDRNYKEDFDFPNLKGRYLWDFLNERGYETGIVNAPGVRKLYKLNGFMSLGLSEDSEIYPEGLDLDREETPIHRGKRISKRIELLMENLDKREKVLSQLLEKNWDFLAFVAKEPDNITHFVNDWDRVEDVYQKIDKHLKLILEKVEDCNIVIASDHGIKKIKRRVFVNSLLEEMNLLQESQNLSKNLLSRLESFLRKKFGKSFVQGLVSSVPFLGGWEAKSMMSLGRLDKEKTKMFGYGARAGSYARLWANSKERFERGILDEEEVDEVIEKTKESLLDSYEDFVGDVEEGSEVYSGRKERWIPDLIVKLADDCVEDYKLESEKATGEEGFAHALDGVFMAYGPDIKSSGERLEELKIYDIAPTILHSFGTKIPKDMDGRVLGKIFKEGTEPAEWKVEFQRKDEKKRVRGEVEKLKETGKI